MNQSFVLRTVFLSALALLEPQIYIDVEQFGAENIPLLSGRLVIITGSITGVSKHQWTRRRLCFSERRPVLPNRIEISCNLEKMKWFLTHLSKY